MRYQNLADGRAMGSDADDSRVSGSVGDLPPLPNESVAPANGPQASRDTALSVAAFQEQLDRLGDDVLAKSTIELRRSINAAHAQFALQVRELERRNIPEFDHRLTTTGWLKRHCQMTPAEASGTVKTARAMVHMPTVASNALAGVVPPRSIQLLGQARDRHPNEFFDHEEVFADVATYLSVADMGRAINHWEQQINYPKALQNAEHVEKLRSLYLAQTINGIGDLKGTLTPQGYTTVKTALDAHADPFNLDADDHRTHAQRRADAPGARVSIGCARLDDHASPLAVVSAPPFRPKEWRNLTLCDGRA